MTDNITLREIYYYNINSFLDTISNIDYVKLKDTPEKLTSIAQDGQCKLIKQDGTYGGLFYASKSVQGNSSKNITNSTNIFTISNDNGIILYMYPFNSHYLIPSNYSKAIYTSGNYLGKNIIVHHEIIYDIEEKVRKITIFY